MFLIDFQKTRREAFLHGFVKGLGAPALLYHHESIPSLPSVFQVSVPLIPIDQALLGDWYKIGSDMRAVVVRHENQLSIKEDRTVIKKHGRSSKESTTKKSRSKRR